MRISDWSSDVCSSDLLGSVALPLRPSMAGAHQMRNAGLAIAMLRLAPEPRPSDAEIARGVAEAFWPARMQHLGAGPLTALLPEGTEIWLDGAHNIDAGLEIGRASCRERVCQYV